MNEERILESAGVSFRVRALDLGALTPDLASQYAVMARAFAKSDYWLATFERGGRAFSCLYATGPGLRVNGRRSAPTAGEIALCIMDDARSIDDCGGFADWCDEMGFTVRDVATGAARASYDVALRLGRELRAVIGSGAWADLEEIER